MSFLQGLFRIYPLPGDPKSPLPPKVFKHLPSSAPVECVVRVYCIKCIDLQPQDPNGLVRTNSSIRTNSSFRPSDGTCLMSVIMNYTNKEIVIQYNT